MVLTGFPRKLDFIQGENFIYAHLLPFFFLIFDTHFDVSHNHNLVNCFSVLLAADIISTVEFNYSGDLLATGDKGGRVVIFQREQEVSNHGPHPQ